MSEAETIVFLRLKIPTQEGEGEGVRGRVKVFLL
jgi:hypothetical protein